MVVLGSAIHVGLNEETLGSGYVLLAGIGFGLALLVAIALFIGAFCSKEELLDYGVMRSEYRYGLVPLLAGLIVISGLTMVSVWNNMAESRHVKHEAWRVTYNGRRPQTILYVLSNIKKRSQRPMRVVVLESDRGRIAYTYAPGSPWGDWMGGLVPGDRVEVRLRLTALGLWRASDVQPVGVTLRDS